MSAQEQLHYDLQVQASLQQRSFAVKGTLSFLTAAYATDSVEIVISQCEAPPMLRLLTAGVKIAVMDTAQNRHGDMAYRFKFAEKQAPGTRLEFAYAYDRGARPSFQYYIDSNFVMACGYGSAWYPQVSSRAEDGSTKYTRGKGRITVTTNRELTPVMAAATLDTAFSGGYKVSAFDYEQPDIFTLYIGNYARQESRGDVPFYCYTLSANVNGDTLARKASEVLHFLTRQFGPLDIPGFSIVEFPDYVSERTGIGGASIKGGILMPSRALQEFNYALFGHELSHQWWGNKVISKGRKGADMLSEGLAQYGSLQVVQHFDSSRAILYRRTGYPGYIPDQSGFGYLKNIAAGNDEPLDDLHGSNGHLLGDSKGFLVLELLSATVGKARFHQALRHIGERYSRTGLRWSDFLQEVATAHGGSLQWFYRQWFERTGAPAWETRWEQQQNKLMLTLTQKDSLYRLPLEVLVTYADGRTALEKIEVRNSVNSITLPADGEVSKVQVDPFFKVIHWDEALRPQALAMGKVQQVLKLFTEQKIQEAAALAQSFLDKGLPDDTFGVEFSLLYYLGRMKGIQQQHGEALQYYQRALQCPYRLPQQLAYTYYRIAQIAQQKKDTALFRWACDNAVKADSMNGGKDDMQAKVTQLAAL
ncbi:hypothetical protein GCM10009415_35250 [Chitinophaga japonensis]